MPALDIENPGVPAVAACGSLFKELLEEASTIKPISTSSTQPSNIEPPLNKTDFSRLSERVASSLSTITADTSDEDDSTKDQVKIRRFGIIETAARDLFGKLIASTPIDSPEFVNMWNFFDILSILSDDGQCDPVLLFWLVEELLDSQTIAGCRIIFDYLESRRERITAKHFKQKNLVILRSCNELLRRLSRAEDTAFCGRVFIFLFQSFPLGDRSSVNLRGEYHVENITTYEKQPDPESQMDVDTQEETQKEPQKESGDTKTTGKGDSKKQDPPLSSDELYNLFWPLQESFSQPLTLFDPSHFQKFKHGIAETVKKFATYPSDEGIRSSSTLEEPRQTPKRKRGESQEDEPAEAFNPKYLTSKDLFELEVSDLTFRRHVLVQILIVLNFILSWTGEAKQKYSAMNVTNKSVMYADEFSEDDAKWAKETKARIADYMKKDTPGKIFHRMVDTVLARDKNWVYWKMNGCPTIQREPVSPQLWAEAQASAQRATTNKRLRPIPLNAVPMDFLKEKDHQQVMQELQDPKRYKLPELDSFKAKIADDDFEISMAANEQAKAKATALKASKTWRALRIAGRFKLAAFDKIDDWNDISVVFEPLEDIDAQTSAKEVAAEEDMPTNRETVVISGPPGAGKSSLIEKLQETHKGVFGRVVRHTTREPSEGETNGNPFHFVKAQEFNQLRDGDRLVEYTEQGDVSYGTSSKAIDTITENGKVAIIEMDLEGARFAKEMMDFPARYILIKPSTPDSLQSRLKGAGGRDDAAVQAILDSLPEQLDESKTAEIFSSVIVNDELDQASKDLSQYLYEKNGEEKQKDEPSNGEEDQKDAEAANGEQMEVDANTES